MGGNVFEILKKLFSKKISQKNTFFQKKKKNVFFQKTKKIIFVTIKVSAKLSICKNSVFFGFALQIQLVSGLSLLPTAVKYRPSFIFIFTGILLVNNCTK